MELLSNLWWLWGMITVVSLGYALRIQYLRAQTISKNVGHTVTSVLSGDPEMIGQSAQRITNDFTNGFFTGMGKAIAAIVVAVIFGLVLLVSVVANLISYFRV